MRKTRADGKRGPSIEIRMTKQLYDQARADLERPHPYAAERLGFLFGKIGNRGTSEPLIILYRYRPLREEQYVDDPTSGGRMDSSAIREAMQELIDHRKAHEGAFHVHLHEHSGPPLLSGMDRREIPKLIQSFRSVCRSAAHGIVLLSKDHGAAHVWLPDAEQALLAARISIIGAPLSILEAPPTSRRSNR